MRVYNVMCITIGSEVRKERKSSCAGVVLAYRLQ